MRVCMLAYTFYESDNRVMRYAETLAKRGDYVEIISLRGEDQPRTENMNGVRVVRIQRRQRDERLKWTYFWRQLTFLIRAAILLTWHHLKRPYDLIHVHSMPDLLVFAALVPKMQNCPIILDIHDLLPDFYISKFKVSSQSLVYKMLVAEERLSVAFSDHVIIPNELWKERLLERSVHDKGLSVFINAPDPSIFHRDQRKRKDNKFVVLYPGSLSWHQGLDIAITAVGLVRARLPNLELHICGLGREMPALTQLVQQLGLQDRVFFLQPRPIREIAKLMREADLGVVPKRSDSFGNEAFSTKILEFMATGVAVVVSNTKVDQYYFNERIVKFFRSEDAEDLAKAIILLVENVEFRRGLVNNALTFVSHNNWKSDRERYVALIEGLTRRRSNPSLTKHLQQKLHVFEHKGGNSELDAMPAGDPSKQIV
jgi:glycosyltransferase involved in cell wall biosynthesis